MRLKRGFRRRARILSGARRALAALAAQHLQILWSNTASRPQSCVTPHANSVAPVFRMFIMAGVCPRQGLTNAEPAVDGVISHRGPNYDLSPAAANSAALGMLLGRRVAPGRVLARAQVKCNYASRLRAGLGNSGQGMGGSWEVQWRSASFRWLARVTRNETTSWEVLTCTPRGLTSACICARAASCASRVGR